MIDKRTSSPRQSHFHALLATNRKRGRSATSLGSVVVVRNVCATKSLVIAIALKRRRQANDRYRWRQAMRFTLNGQPFHFDGNRKPVPPHDLSTHSRSHSCRIRPI